jgi:hypothetical protein
MTWVNGAWDTIIKLLARAHTWGGINKFELPIHIKESTTPSAITDYGAIYPKSDNALYFQDGAGAEHTVDLDGAPTGVFVRRDGTAGLTADWDAGAFEIRAETLESDVVTGTAPLTIASTTKVANLNVAMVDPINTLADSATIDIDWSLSNNHEVTLGGNRTYTFSNIPDGGWLRLRQVQDGTGSRVPVWPATAKWPGDVTPTPTSTAAAIDVYTFLSDGTNLELIGFAADVK